MTTAERVILIQGDSNKWYDQAIFIVKPNAKENIPVDMVAEAEKIIHNYMIKNNKPFPVNFPTQKTFPTSTTHVTGYAASVPISNVVSVTKTKKRPHGRLDIIFNIIMFFACLALVGVLVFGLLP
jgi:hypothetical protein